MRSRKEILDDAWVRWGFMDVDYKFNWLMLEVLLDIREEFIKLRKQKECR